MKTRGIVFDMEQSLVEPSATVLYDRSRYGSNGDFESDGHPDWVRRPSGLWVLDFDSSHPDYVEIPAAYTQLNFTSEKFSVIARIRVDSLTSARRLFTRGAHNADGWYAYIATGGYLVVCTMQTGAIQLSWGEVGGVSIATNYTVGFSRDGAGITTFKNGVDDTASSGTHINPATCSRSAKIGIHDNKVSEPWDGKIAFLRIYSYALSATQHRKMHDTLVNWE